MPKDHLTVAHMRPFLPKLAEHDNLGNRILKVLSQMPCDSRFPADSQDRPHNAVENILSDWPKNMDQPRRNKVCQRFGSLIARTWQNYADAHQAEKQKAA